MNNEEQNTQSTPNRRPTRRSVQPQRARQQRASQSRPQRADQARPQRTSQTRPQRANQPQRTDQPMRANQPRQQRAVQLQPQQTRQPANQRNLRQANAGHTYTPLAYSPMTQQATTQNSFPTPLKIALIALLVIVLAILGFSFASGKIGGSGANNATNGTSGDATSSSQLQATDKNATAGTISFTMSFTGDCCLGNDENFGYSGRMPEYYDNYGPSYFFQNVKSIFDADDYTVVDMEGTFTTRTTRNYETFAFKADPEYVNILTYGNVQAATLANNHSHDYGDESYTDTWQTLEKAGIVPFGYDDIAYVDIKGVKVALIGMYELDEYLGIKDNMLENIQKAKDNNAQVIIMCAHWGEEKMYVPDEIQVELGHAAIDAGCDLIVGCHPHRVQGIEKYHGKYIAYSMGNFCFCGNNAPADMDCYIFQQTFTLENGELKVDDNVNVIPCSISSDESINNYQPTPATGAQATEINEKIADCNAQLAAEYNVTTM